jgi:hypothetical protein
MQVNEGLVMVFITHEHIAMKLCLDNFDIVSVQTNHLALIGQMVVYGLVRGNLVFRNAKFIPKLLNNLCYVEIPRSISKLMHKLRLTSYGDLALELEPPALVPPRCSLSIYALSRLLKEDGLSSKALEPVLLS